MWHNHLLHCLQTITWVWKTRTDKQIREWERLKQRDTGAESFWPIRSYEWVAVTEWVFCHLTCRQGRCWDLLNGLDKDFLCCLMELTLFYLCAISVRALYTKCQSISVDSTFAKKASPQPFQRVLDHCWIIDRYVVGQGQSNNCFKP